MTSTAQGEANANSRPLTYAEADGRMRAIAERRSQARAQLKDANEKAAEAERRFRKTRADAFKEARDRGEPIEGAKIIADGESCTARETWDKAVAVVKDAEERILEIDANRSMLRARVEWSREVATKGAPG